MTLTYGQTNLDMQVKLQSDAFFTHYIFYGGKKVSGHG